MSSLTIELPKELDEKIKNAAMREAKEPSEFIVDMLESILAEASFEFIGAWSDLDIDPNNIIEARTRGRDIGFGN